MGAESSANRAVSEYVRSITKGKEAGAGLYKQPSEGTAEIFPGGDLKVIFSFSVWVFL